MVAGDFNGGAKDIRWTSAAPMTGTIAGGSDEEANSEQNFATRGFAARQTKNLRQGIAGGFGGLHVNSYFLLLPKRAAN